MNHPDPQDLTALAYGLVGGSERERLLEHLAECHDCRALYDSYREESLLVGRAVLTDARNEPAEAQALERTLEALSLAPEPQGRVVRFFGWARFAQIAAVLVLALGLLLIFSNRDDDAGILTVAEDRRAPAQVQNGVVFVPGSEGAWQQAEAVPLDQWVKAGADPLELLLADGSPVHLAGDSIFRLVLDLPGEGGTVVQLLHGNGRLSSTTGQVKVRTGEMLFRVMPGAEFAFSCEAEDGLVSEPRHLRSWTSPHGARVNVDGGDVLFLSGTHELANWPLQLGESIEWSKSGIVARRASGVSLPLSVREFAEREVGDELNSRIDALVNRHPELQAVFSRLPNFDLESGKFVIKLHNNGEPDLQSNPGARGFARVSWTADGHTMTATLEDGVITLAATQAGVTRSVVGGTIDDARRQLPDDLKPLFERLEGIYDAQGNLIGLRTGRG